MPISTSEPGDPSLTLKALADEIGFDTVRITGAELPDEIGDRLRAYVAVGHHGEMDWLEETLDRRAHPRSLWPDARSAVVVGLNYGPDHDPMENLKAISSANISVYARHRDYHDVLKKRLKRLAREFAEQTGEDVKIFVDTAPLMEKPLAARAGLGWQGKHTNLVSREFGSWLFLGVMLTTADLPQDTPETDHCGSCRACLDVCPTNAFPAPYQIDARRCLSYLTIELDGPVPEAFREPMGNRIYGCDDCLAVCPWNKFAAETRERLLAARNDLSLPALADLVGLDDTRFRAHFSGSPIKRIKRHRFIRNVLYAIGNSGDESLIPLVLARLDDEHPTVRGAAVWALSRLDPERARDEAVKRLTLETDTAVCNEWLAIND